MAKEFKFLNMYKVNNQIIYETSKCTESPENYKESYSENLKLKFKELNLVFEKFIQSSESNVEEEEKVNYNDNNDKSQVQGKDIKNVISFTNQCGYKYVLKRKAFFALLKGKDEMQLSEEVKVVESTLNKYLSEYFISRIVSAHSAGVLALDFSITLLTGLNYIVFEFLAEKKGESLDQMYFHEEYLSKFSYNFFYTLVDVMDFIERNHIVYGDLKLENLVFDYKTNNIKLIDYDSSLFPTLEKDVGGNLSYDILRITPGYESPELKYLHDNILNLGMQKPLNPWKSDVYSCGILGLIFSGSINDKEKLKTLEEKKFSEKKHNKFIGALLNRSNWSNLDGKYDKDLTEKMKLIIGNCLRFNPEERVSFKKLKKILKNIKSSFNKISDDISSYSRKIHGTKRELKKKIYDLEEDKEKLKKQISEIENTKKDVIESIDNRLKEYNSNNLLNSNPLIVNINGLIEKMHKWNTLIIKDYKIRRSIIDFAIKFKQVDFDYAKKLLDEFDSKNSDNILKNGKNPYEEIPSKVMNIKYLIEHIYYEGKEFRPHPDNYSEEDNKIINDCLTKEVKISKDFPPVKYLGEAALEFIVRPKNVLENIKEELKQLNYDQLLENLSEGIRDKISKILALKTTKWSFHKTNMKFKDILIIFELVKKSPTPITLINFYGTQYFDDDCGNEYFELLKENKTIQGIDLNYLNFSKDIKLKILSLFAIKENLQYLIMENQLISEHIALSYKDSLNLHLNDRFSQYWQQA